MSQLGRALLLLGLSTLLWSIPLLTSQMAGVMDLPIHYQWTAQFARSLREGVWLPRWNAASNQGLGDATFVHIHPLYYYLAALLNTLLDDLWLSMRAVVIAAHLALGLACYRVVGRLFGAQGALGSALAAQWAPYPLLMVVYGQALPTLLALPFAVVVIGSMVEDLAQVTSEAGLERADFRPPDRRLLLIGCMALAGVVLSHVLVAFTLILCLGCTLGLCLAWPGPWMDGPARRRLWAWMVRWTGGCVLALCISAWYLVPALLGRSWIHRQAWALGELVSPALSWANNAIFPLEALWRGDAVNQVLLVWLPLPATLTCLWACRAVWQSRAQRSKASPELVALLCFTGLGLAALFFASGASAWLWSLSGTLQQTQFPWRFMGMLSLAAALLIGHVSFQRGRVFIPAGRGLLALTLMVSAFLMGMTIFKGAPVVPGAAWLSGQFGQPEYLPAAVPMDWAQRVAAVPACETELVGRAARCRLLVEQWQLDRSHDKRLVLAPSQPMSLVLPVFFHPGWKATLDGKPAAIVADGRTGLVGLQLPEGRHEVRLFWAGTWLDQIGRIVSVMGALTWMAGLLHLLRLGRRARATAVQ